MGCPIWSNRDWVGRFFTADARSQDFLRQYSSVFNTVEGNTTFYGLPKRETVMRWREESAPDFRFCFKFPRTVSHDLKLSHAGAETREFLDRLEPLGEKLGPLFLQLSPAFKGEDLPKLRDYLSDLSADFAYAVEVRHRDFFAKGDAETALNRLLHERAIDRVILDSRALFSAAPEDDDTREAQRKKPRVPVHAIALGPRPMVRFIGHPDVTANQTFLQPWVAKISAWIGEGRTPFLFAHTPDNHYAPELARVFHTMLARRLSGIGSLPAWPVAGVPDEQMGLL